MQENEISIWPSENQEITQERLQDHQASQYRSTHHAKTQPAMPSEEETEMEIVRGIGDCRTQFVGTKLYGHGSEQEMGNGYYVYSVRKLDPLSFDNHGLVQ